jgi:hypothetical protein
MATTFLVLNTLGRQTKLSALLSKKNSPVFFWISCHNFCNSFEPWSAYGSVPRVLLKSIVQPPSCLCYHMWNHSGHCGPSCLASFTPTSVKWGIWMSQYDDAQFPWLWPPNWKYFRSFCAYFSTCTWLETVSIPPSLRSVWTLPSSPQIILSQNFHSDSNLFRTDNILQAVIPQTRSTHPVPEHCWHGSNKIHHMNQEVW